jgi:diaminopimelate decarboxylase
MGGGTCAVVGVVALAGMRFYAILTLALKNVNAKNHTVCYPFPLQKTKTDMPRFTYNNNTLHLDKMSLDTIAKHHGTPLYVYSKDCIQEHFSAYQQGFGNHPHLICYAVKANANLHILSLLARLGAGFDIVSGGELIRVLEAGASPERVVFSGVGKTEEEILMALNAGIHCFNVESAAELHTLAALVKDTQQTAQFSLRINPDVDAKTHPYISTGLKENKFGITVDHARELYLEFATTLGLTPIGVDCHIGSQITELSPFMEMTDKVSRFINNLRKSAIHLHHVDLGGGLGIDYRNDTPPSPKELATLYATAFPDLKILIEPGRSIVGSCGCFLTEVQYLKPGELKNFAIVDGGMNDLARPALYNAWQNILPVQRREEPTAIYDIVGPVCESTDFLGKGRELAIQAGDVLAVMDSGAYGLSMASNYNARRKPAEIWVDNGVAVVIRERERYPDLYALERPAQLRFTKMEGLGNDFVVIDATATPLPPLTPTQITRLADRHFGIGFDQLLVVEPARDAGVDFVYRIFNADGSEVNQCGNGARCFARFVYDTGLTRKTTIIAQTGSGQLTLELIGENQVRVNMGIPKFAPHAIPLDVTHEQATYTIGVAGETIEFMVANLGNPHAVITVDNVEAYPVDTIGAVLESHQLFPERVNVGFMQIQDPHHIRLRVFERGSGETLACGSGACAAVICGIKSGQLSSPVTVELHGGTLQIEWQGQDVYKTGPAHIIYEGTVWL